MRYLALIFLLIFIQGCTSAPEKEWGEYYTKISLELEDNFSSQIAEDCLRFSTDYRRISCLESFIKYHYEYLNSNASGVKSPGETFEDGGVCRDWAVAVCNVAKEMNYSCEVHYFKKLSHVIPIIDHDDFYCFVEGDDFTCKWFNI